MRHSLSLPCIAVTATIPMIIAASLPGTMPTGAVPGFGTRLGGIIGNAIAPFRFGERFNPCAERPHAHALHLLWRNAWVKGLQLQKGAVFPIRKPCFARSLCLFGASAVAIGVFVPFRALRDARKNLPALGIILTDDGDGKERILREQGCDFIAA